MRWVVLLRARAERDLADAKRWYEREQEGLGERFVAEFAEALRELAVHPTLPRLYEGDFRRILLPRFPYKVFYLLAGNRLIVFRILHAAQEHKFRLRQ